MEITLVRQYYKNGVNGELYIGRKLATYTIELPWRENQRRISCIPEGRYAVRKRYSARFGWHLAVDHVKNRDGILIHAFNHALEESKGCIGPVTTITGEGQGSSSRLALDKLLTMLSPILEKETIFLIIKSKDNGNNHAKGQKANTKVL